MKRNCDKPLVIVPYDVARTERALAAARKLKDAVRAVRAVRKKGKQSHVK